MPYYLLYRGYAGLEVLEGSPYDNQKDAEADLLEDLVDMVKDGWDGEYILATAVKRYDGRKARINIECEEMEG